LLAGAEGKYDSAEHVFRRMRDENKAVPDVQIRSNRALARISRIRGRLAETEQYTRAVMQSAEAVGDFGTYLSVATELADLDLEFRGNRARALATMREALARHPLDKLPPLNRPYDRLAVLYARAGDRETARRLLREYETAVADGVRRGNQFRGFAYGELALADGRLAEAAAAFRSPAEEWALCLGCGQHELGKVFDRAGQPDSARAAYERDANMPGLFRIMGDAFTLAASYKRLGELYEARGDRKRAADYYGKFVDLWKDADPELRPAVTEIRQRLARLAQEPGT
jgi:tetratricopeptide (TPR) repeat protein